MKTVFLIGCSRSKKKVPGPAQDTYCGALFKLHLHWARAGKPDKILILSTKYYVVEPDQTICPYDYSIRNLSQVERQAWADIVINYLEDTFGFNSQKDRFVLLCGKQYYQYLIPKMKYPIVPFEGMGQMEQLQKIPRLLGSKW